MDVTGLNQLAEHVAEREDALLDTAATDEAVRHAIAERAAAPRARKAAPRRTGRVVLAAAAAVALLVLPVVLWVWRAPRPSNVTFTVGEPPRGGRIGEWLSAPPDAPIPLQFSDGTSARLEAASRARVVRTSAAGAELVLEAGRATLAVVAGQHADYRVRSGPFEVLVTGTRFEIAWSSERDEFELTLHEGRVRVLGCGMGDGIPVEAGHLLRASCRPAKFSVSPRGSVTELRAAASAGTAKPTDTKLEEAPSHAVKRAAPPQPAPVRVGGWLTLAQQGHFKQAYEAASAAGFEAEAARAPAGDLLLLGDTARLSGHADRAVQVYLTARRRFPGSAAAAQAAFYLGRLGAGGGVQWFETYLAERPSGPLAEAALGRLLEVEVRRGDRVRARALANKYLAAHPAGPHAKAARDVLAAPAGD